jgi:serine O-acetyltransferase
MNGNISQGVAIGQNTRGNRIGCPTIGHNVYFGRGAKVFGKINIGDNVAIGANAVVNFNVPSNCTFGGVPAQEISSSGSEQIVVDKFKQ